MPEETIPVVEPNEPTREFVNITAAQAFGDDNVLPAAPAPEPVKPAAPAPAPEPPKPAAQPAAPAPATAPKPVPAAEQKVTINGKDFTVAELEKAMAERTAPPAPTPAPAPAQEPPKPLSKEEVAQREAAYVEEFAKKIDVGLTEVELDTILAGGKDGLATFKNFAAKLVAQANMHTRKGMYDELNPVVSELAQAVGPLIQQNFELQKVATEQSFTSAYPEYKSGRPLEMARRIGEGLVNQYPEVVKQMTREQYFAEVDRQTNALLDAEYKQWNRGGAGSWKDAVRAAAAPPAAPAPALVAAPAPAPAAQTPPAKPTLQPPGANSPAAINTAGASNWHKTVAKSLQD